MKHCDFSSTHVIGRHSRVICLNFKSSLTLPEHLRSILVCVGVHVAQFSEFYYVLFVCFSVAFSSNYIQYISFYRIIKCNRNVAMPIGRPELEQDGTLFSEQCQNKLTSTESYI